MSVDELKEKNNLENNLLKIGITITIPGTKDYQSYVIRTDDTLEDLAKKFNTTIEAIKRVNNLITDDVSVGQIILIPN